MSALTTIASQNIHPISVCGIINRMRQVVPCHFEPSSREISFGGREISRSARNDKLNRIAVC